MSEYRFPSTRSAPRIDPAMFVFMWVVLALLTSGCRDKIQPGSEPVASASEASDATAATTRVERVVAPSLEHASGTVASSHRTAISAKILARIEAVEVAAGSFVSKGDLLIRLDARDLRAQHAQVRETLRAARARLDLARRDQERVAELFAASVASEEQLDEARSALRVAQADVQGAKQRVADADVALSYAEIRTPVSGRVIDRLAEPGDMASPGVPLLRIYDPSALRLEAPVRESVAVSLEVGQVLSVYLDAIDKTLEGAIEEIVPFAEPGARTLLVKIRLPNDPRLFAGMYGRVAIPSGSSERLMVSDAAIVHIGQLAFATVVDDEGRAERRWLTTGRTDAEGGIEVLSGLSDGERVRVARQP